MAAFGRREWQQGVDSRGRDQVRYWRLRSTLSGTFADTASGRFHGEMQLGTNLTGQQPQVDALEQLPLDVLDVSICVEEIWLVLYRADKQLKVRCFGALWIEDDKTEPKHLAK